MDLSALEANYTPGTTQKNTAPQKKKGRGGFLTSLISEGGAAGGALGGAAAGTAILPGIGTLIGGALGGLAGGFGGSAAEQKVRDDSVDWKKAASEGLVSGATSAIAPGGAGSLLKGGLKKGAQVAAEDVAEQGVKAGAKSIPVKFVPSETVGTGVRQTTKNTLTNPTVGELNDAIAKAQGQGFSISQRSGTTPGSKMLGNVERGLTPSFTPIKTSPRLPSVEISGTKTGVRFGDSQSGNAQILEGTGVPQARSQAIQRGKEVAGITDSQPSKVIPADAEAIQQPKTGLLSKFSKANTKSGSGLKVGGNVGDVNSLDQATEVLQRHGISGTPTKQLRKVDETMGKLGGQVDEILAKNPIKLDGTAVKSQVQQAIDDPLKYAELDLTTPGAQKALESHLNKFSGATTAKEVNDYIKTLNPIAKRAQDKLARGSAITDKESAALAAKRSGDEVLSQFPEIKPLKTDMAVLFERNPEIAKLSEQKAGIPLLGIKSRTAQQAVSGVQSKLGQATSKVAGAAENNPSLLGKIKKPFAAQLAASGVSNLNDASQQQEQPATPEQSLAPDMSAALPTEVPQEAYSQENMLADIKRDPKNADTYLGLYKSLADSNTTKPLSAEAAKIQSNANIGLQAISDFQNAIAQDPSVLSKRVIPGRGLLGGAVAGALGTSSADAAASQIVDVIARLRTGAAITNDEAKRFEAMIPQASDPENVRQQKLNYLASQFQMVAQNTGSAGTDTQAALGM